MKYKIPSPLAPLKNNDSGMAILLVLSFIMMISFIAKELALESRVEYEFSNVSYKDLKAYHAAKSGMEMSLFRIMVFQQTEAQFGDKIPDKSMLDLIWSFPMQWPPQLAEDASLIAKDDLEDVKSESLQDAQWITFIAPEGSKIDLNDLDSPSEALKKAVQKQIEQLIRNRLEQEDNWARDQNDISPETIVQHMTDYIDNNEESLVGGAESSYYEDSSVDQLLPPNRMFRTIDELLKIPGMDPVLYEYLKPQLSLFGIRAVNVNAASIEVLRSIDPQITEELATEIKNQIGNPEEGPFTDEEEFKEFISRDIEIGSFNPDKIPLVFNEDTAFKIETEGSYGGTVRSINAIVFNVEKVTKSLEETLKKEAEEKQSEEGEVAPGSDDATEDTGPASTEDSNTDDGSQNNKDSAPGVEQKKPLVVWWQEY